MVNKRPPEFYEDLVNAINDLYGRHPGYRAVHARGIFCKGVFVPAPEAQRVSRAAHFQSGRIPVLARFSNGSGNATAGDHEPDARGLAVKFNLKGGAYTDLVAITLPFFPVRTPEDFLAFIRARKPDPVTKAPDQAKLGAFLSTHPETQRALAAVASMPPPKSYAEATYNSIHAFVLRNAEDQAVNARYRLVPVDAEKARPAGFPPEPSQNVLQDELRQRMSAHPVQFDLIYILGTSADDPVNPTVPWPSDRVTVNCGRIELNEIVPPTADGRDDLIFDPNNVIDGIACSEDEILHARGAAYSVSYARRTAR
jgi:catalase